MLVVYTQGKRGRLGKEGFDLFDPGFIINGVGLVDIGPGDVVCWVCSFSVVG